MAKFYGKIGYIETKMYEAGAWDEVATERPYSGDIIRNLVKRESSGGVNDNINISNKISILSDPYATEHFFAIKYVKFNVPKLGGVWEVTDVEVAYPRLTLTIGGVYNGKQAKIAE